MTDESLLDSRRAGLGELNVDDSRSALGSRDLRAHDNEPVSASKECFLFTTSITPSSGTVDDLQRIYTGSMTLTCTSVILQVST